MLRGTRRARPASLPRSTLGDPFIPTTFIYVGELPGQGKDGRYRGQGRGSRAQNSKRTRRHRTCQDKLRLCNTERYQSCPISLRTMTHILLGLAAPRDAVLMVLVCSSGQVPVQDVVVGTGWRARSLGNDAKKSRRGRRRGWSLARLHGIGERGVQNGVHPRTEASIQPEGRD